MTADLAKPVIDAGIVTKDLNAAHWFYGVALGLPMAGEVEIPQYGLVRRYSVGDSTLRVFLPDVLPDTQPTPKGGGSGFASQTGIRYLTLYVTNLDDVAAAIEQAGFKLVVPVRQLRPGVRVCQVEDGEGNTIELMEEA